MPGPIDYSLINVRPDPDTKEWWDATKEDRLLVRQCNDCIKKFFPPFPACPGCTSMNLGWHETEGKGVIYSYNVVVQPILAPFVPAVPYITAVIDLPDCTNDDGSITRIVGVLVDDEDAVAIGNPVEVVFEKSEDAEYVMPRWRVTGVGEDAWKFTGRGRRACGWVASQSCPTPHQTRRWRRLAVPYISPHSTVAGRGKSRPQ